MVAGTDFVSMLMEMGFTKEKAERGLSMTGNKGVEAAMEWIFSHPEEFDSGTSTNTSEAGPSNDLSSENKESQQDEAKSIKCDDCGKLFKSQLEVEYHATKSSHSNFSESTEEKKPLTDEEKQEQIRRIKEKLKETRRKKEEEEKQEALLKEKQRIQSGKEMTEAKKKKEELEMKKLIEQRKREKEEEKQARLRVKRLIEADKLARKGINAESNESIVKNTAISEPTLAATIVNSTPKDYSQTKIQVRLTNGSALTETFSVKEQLAAVRLFVTMNRTDGIEPFSLMTNFPKKIFTEEEYEKTLESLNLIPTAVLIVTKNKPLE